MTFAEWWYPFCVLVMIGIVVHELWTDRKLRKEYEV